MKFRIIVPMFNSSGTIERCIESIKSQAYTNFEVVIVDDMSNDDSVDIVTRSISGDNRFHLVRLDYKRFGGGARNAGLDVEVSSDYTLFLDSDDAYHSVRSLELISDCIVKNGFPDGVLCPYYLKTGRRVKKLSYSSVETFLYANPVNAPWTVCVKSDIVPKFSENVVGYDDIAQHYRQYDLIKTLSCVDEAIVDYMNDGVNSIWNCKNKSRENQLRKDISFLYTFHECSNEIFKNKYVKDSIDKNFLRPYRNMFDDLKSKYSTWYDDIIKRGCLVIGNMEKCKIEKGDVKRDMTKNVEKNVTKKKNIKWNDIFDSIWCISFTGYPERKKGMESEFKRLGILNSGVFNWRFTFPTIFDNILFDVTKKQLKHNDCINVSSMSCSLGHYGCIKTAYELGHEFALFMEDDIRFLKNVEDIDTIVKSIPPCADVVNFDVLPTESRYTKDNYGALMEKNSYNDHFFRYDGEILWGASCYALSRKAMERILQRYEQMLYVADGYTSGKIFLGKDVSYFASKESICCQLTFGKSVNAMIFGNNALHGVYSKKSLDYSKYNIFDKEGYTHGCSI